MRYKASYLPETGSLVGYEFLQISQALNKKDQALLYKINRHLDLLDEQLEKLEANEVDVYWQVPTSISFELAEIEYKLGKAKERMARVLAVKKARRR